MKIVSRMKRMWLVVAALVCASVAWAGNLASGTYYMKNVAAGKYLTGGNAWGTQASLAIHGLDMKVEVLENGKYTLDSNVPNGTNKYLGSIGYIDCEATEWTLVEVDPQTYAITADGVNYIGYDGSTTVVNLALTDATSPAAHWEFITKDDLIADMASATATNPVDATFFIVGQGFNRGDTNRNTVWQGGPAIGGNNDNMVAEKWNCNFDVYQDLTGLPNGLYKLSAQGFYRAGNAGNTDLTKNAYLYANEVSSPMQNILAEAGNSVFEGGNVSAVAGYGNVPNNMAIVSTAFSAGLYADNSLIVEVTDGTLRIGVKKDILVTGDWTIFDNFELTYYGTEKPTEGDDSGDNIGGGNDGNDDNEDIVDGVRQYPTLSSILSEVPMDGTFMYMYNVGAKKFFCGANAWGAQTSIGDKGYMVCFEQYLGDGAWDGTTVYFRDSVENKGQIREVFFDNSDGSCWVDRGSQYNYFWKLEKNYDNDYFRLSMAEANPDYYWQLDMPDTYFGWNEANGTVVTAFLNPYDEGVHVDWAFVTVEEYNKFAGKVAIYHAAQELKILIDNANSLGINVQAQNSVYLNMSATAADIEKAINEVELLLAAWDEGHVNPLIPVDKTSLIVNPSYDNNKNDGWKGTTPGLQNYDNAEHYNKTFDTYQDLINVPNGLYKLSVQGFYRPATEGITGAVFYADNGIDRLTVDVPNINSESELVAKPNNMQTASEAFHAGYYDTGLFVDVNNGTLRIGVALPQLTGSSDWVIWDNWRLTYYGNDENVYSVVLDSLANCALSEFDGREAEMTVGLLDSYRETLNRLPSSGLADFNAGKIAIDEAAADMRTNIKGWVKYEAEIKRANDIRSDNYDSDSAMGIMAAYVVRQAPAILKAKTLSTEELWIEIAKLEQLIWNAIVETIPDNTDVTDLYLTNADFSQGTTGWSGSWTAVNYGCMEAYQLDWDAYQVVQDASVGVYEVSLQGFYRVQRGEDAYTMWQYGQQTCPGHVYVNNHETDVKCVFSEPVRMDDYIFSNMGTDPESNPSAFIDWETGDSVFFPNDMLSASEAFAAGMYVAKANGIVAKQGDELRIGVKGKQQVATWVIWDNFKMIYRGKQLTYTIPYLQEAVEDAYDKLNNPLDKDTRELLEDALINAENHLGSSDEDAVFDALVQLYAALESVGTSADLMVQLEQEIAKLDNAIWMYDGQTTDEAIEMAVVLLEQLLMAQDGNCTREEIVALLEQVEPAISALAMGDYSNASDENPVDFTALIKSASFENEYGEYSAEGWNGTAGYIGYGAYEFWEKSFELYQELKGLPNGTYRLEVSAYERIGSSIEDYDSYMAGIDSATAYIYGQSGNAYYETSVRRLASGASTNYVDGMAQVGTAASGDGIWVSNSMLSASIMFNDYAEYQNVMYVLVTDGTLRIGMRKDTYASNDWVIMDNWRLYYHGTNSQFAPGDTPSDKDEFDTANTFSVYDTEVMKGSTFELPVYMTNVDGISAFQCDIYLSSGLQMNYNDEGDYAFTLNSNRATSSHTIASELQADGAIRVIVYSNSSKLFRGNDGELFTLNLSVSSLLNQSVSIRNIHLSTADEVEYLSADITSNITVKTFTPADVDDNGMVTIVDVVAVVNRLLGSSSGKFVFEAADMDQNGEITIVDVVAVVNVLLGRNVQATGARSILHSDIHVADAEVAAGETTTLYVKLDNAQAYTAMQVDVELTEGLSIEGVEMVGNASHTVTYNAEGRIAAYSLVNRTFNGGESLMAITVKADESFTGTAHLDFANVRVVSKDVVETTLADAFSTVTGGAYGIDAVEADKAQVLYYSTTGEVSDKPFQGLNIIQRIYQDGRVEVTKEMK